MKILCKFQSCKIFVVLLVMFIDAWDMVRNIDLNNMATGDC